jgi:hypothetical protein
MSDSTDGIPYKARLVADEDWNAFIESSVSPNGADWRLITNIYQCPNCGRLRIEKPSGCVSFFLPEGSDISKALLGSVKKKRDEREGV